MNEPTEKEFKEVQEWLKKMVAKMTSKEYLDALDKLANICAKQNPQLN
jgi:hypothetical protein